MSEVSVLENGKSARMRPRMRPGVSAVPTDSGLYVRCADRELLLRGGGATRWFARLTEVLDGGRELGEIEASLVEGQVSPFRRAVDELVRAGLVYDMADDVELPATTRELYVDSLSVLLDRCDRPYAAFQRYRTGRMLITGSAVGVAVVARASAERGLGAASVHTADPSGRRYLDAVVADLIDGSMDIDVKLVDDDEVLPEVAGVVHIDTDSYQCPRSREIARQAARRGVPYLPAGRAGNVLYVGPLSRPDQPACHTCAARRLADADGRGTSVRPVGRELLELTISGGLVASLWYAHRTGLASAILDADVLSVDCADLTTRHHVITPYPDCPDCAGRSAASGRSAARHTDRAPTTQNPAVDPVVDDPFGMFASCTGHDVPQVPIDQVEVVLNRAEEPGAPPPRIRVSGDLGRGLESRAAVLGASFSLRSSPDPAPLSWYALDADGAAGDPVPDRMATVRVLADCVPTGIGIGLCDAALRAGSTDRAVEPLEELITAGVVEPDAELLGLVKLANLFLADPVLVRRRRPVLELPATVVDVTCGPQTATVIDIACARGIGRCLAEILSAVAGIDQADTVTDVPGPAYLRPSRLIGAGLANDLYGSEGEWRRWLPHAVRSLAFGGHLVAFAVEPRVEPLRGLGLEAVGVHVSRTT